MLLKLTGQPSIWAVIGLVVCYIGIWFIWSNVGFQYARNKIGNNESKWNKYAGIIKSNYTHRTILAIALILFCTPIPQELLFLLISFFIVHHGFMNGQLSQIDSRKKVIRGLDSRIDYYKELLDKKDKNRKD